MDLVPGCMELTVYLLVVCSFLTSFFFCCFVLFLSHFLIYQLYTELFKVLGWVLGTWR